MQGNLASKLQGFRKEIRREQIQAYKKSKRKELLQESTGDSGMDQTYLGVLRHHQLSNLNQMSSEILRSHMQMLVQLIFSHESIMFVDAFQKIMIILLEFYEEEINKRREQAMRYLSHIEIDQQHAYECIDVYALTQVFSFIPANTFLKILGGIYHDINPSRNDFLLHKVILSLKNILNFTFIDCEKIKYLVQFFQGGLDWRVNKSINRDFIFTIFMNMSYSEDYEIAKIITDENIFGRIQESIQVYGLSLAENMSLSQFYGNCIEYLCSKVKQVAPEYQNQNYMQQIQICLYIPIFEHLINLENQDIVQNLIHTAVCLFQTSFQCGLSCKGQVMDIIGNMVRSIIKFKEYFEQSERIFILFAKYNDFENCGHYWLVDFLENILKKHTMIYFMKPQTNYKRRQKGSPMSKGKILRNIKELLIACQLILNRCNPDILSIQQYLVKSIFQLWYKDELISDSKELIAFFQTAIQHNKQISDLIIFERYAEQFVTFLGEDYQFMQEKHAIIKLIKSTCNRIHQSNLNQVQTYLTQYSREWNTISTRLQDYCSQQDIIHGEYCHQAYNVNQIVSQMLKKGFIQ